MVDIDMLGGVMWRAFGVEEKFCCNA